MRISFTFFLLLSVFALFAQEKVNIIASASIFSDMAQNIGGDKVKTTSIVPIGGDPHLYEPKPSDAQLVKNADLILVNGLTFEGWISKLIENSNTNAPVDTITAGITPIASVKYKNAADPHAWMDASNGVKYCENILNSLVAVDPDNADYYKNNFNAYSKKIKDLDAYIQAEILKIPEAKRMLVTSHDAFAYYGKRYNIELNALKGISTEAETQTSDMVRVSKAIKSSGVPAIFIESTINPKVIQQIAKDNNVLIGGELFADSIGDEESDGHSYIDMLKHNTDVIVGALSQNSMSKTMVDTEKKGNSMLLYGVVGLAMLAGLLLVIFKSK